MFVGIKIEGGEEINQSISFQTFYTIYSLFTFFFIIDVVVLVIVIIIIGAGAVAVIIMLFLCQWLTYFVSIS